MTGRVQKKCKAKRHEHYVEEKAGEGRCVECEPCRAGSGWNFTDIRQNPPRKSEHGDLDCYKCYECPEGYFRENDSSELYCPKCRRNCTLAHRYVDKPCGGHNEGNCGSCLPGFYDPTRNRQKGCIPEIPTVPVVPQTLSPNIANLTHHHGSQSFSKLAAASISPIAGHVIFGVAGGFILLAVLAIALFCFRNKLFGLLKCHTGHSDLLTDVISSVGSSLGQQNSANMERESLLEMDCGPHPEVSLLTSNPGPECIHKATEPYPTFKLNKNDKCLTNLAQNGSLFGEQVEEFFRNLGVSQQNIYGHKHRYEQKVCTYNDYILAVLIDWVKQDGTFDKLCKALDQADFHEEVTVPTVNFYYADNPAARSEVLSNDPAASRELLACDPSPVNQAIEASDQYCPETSCVVDTDIILSRQHSV